MSPEKYCPKCKQTKQAEEFGQHKGNPDGRDRVCWECKRDRQLRKAFGIGLGQYREMLKAQGGRCAICGRVPGEKDLAVDHDHVTGSLRGLLCYNCNVMLGAFENKGAAFMQYLRRHGSCIAACLEEEYVAV
jgi:hypothetical protein